MRILRVDGVVHLAPARLERLGAPPPGNGTVAALPTVADRELGAGLARASRLLEDCDP